MKKLFLFAAIILASMSCQSNITTTPKEPEQENGNDVNNGPVMGEVQSIETKVPELSSLCLSADGSSLWSISDDTNANGGIYALAFDGTSSRKMKILRDLEGITINPTNGDLYLAIEGEQTICRIPAPAYEQLIEIGTIEPSENGATDPTGKGLEGITWYKNDTLLVANQQYPTVISVYSLASKKVVRNINIDYATFLSDLSYDAVDDVIWIADSKRGMIYRSDLTGRKLSSYNVSSYVNIGGSQGKTEGLTVDRAHNCIWIGCDNNSMLFKISMQF